MAIVETLRASIAIDRSMESYKAVRIGWLARARSAIEACFWPAFEDGL